MVNKIEYYVGKVKPSLIMLVGIPGSGKSFFAKHLRYTISDERGMKIPPRFTNINIGHPGSLILEYDPEFFSDDNNVTIFSSDDLREELYGDAAIQGDNNALFNELHNRIKNALNHGECVVYDATNINKKLRMKFLNEIAGFDINKICIAIMTPYPECVERCNTRDRVVEEKVVRNMYMNWQPPHKHEGFDSVRFFNDGNDDTFKLIADEYDVIGGALDEFDQENEHHNLSLGQHCKKAYDIIMSDPTTASYSLCAAALFHDIGKVETKTNITPKGVVDEKNYHYYQHHCVGAYLYALLWCFVDIIDIQDSRTAYVANLIYYHMHPYCSWKQSDKAMERDKKIIGETMFNDVMRLHEADEAAH